MFSIILLLMLVSQPLLALGYEDNSKQAYSHLDMPFESYSSESDGWDDDRHNNKYKDNSEYKDDVFERAFLATKVMLSEFKVVLKSLGWSIICQANTLQGTVTEEELLHTIDDMIGGFYELTDELGIEASDFILLLTAVAMYNLVKMEVETECKKIKQDLESRVYELKNDWKTNDDYSKYKMVALNKCGKQTIITYQNSFKRLRQLELKILEVEENRCKEPPKIMFIRENRVRQSKDFASQTEKVKTDNSSPVLKGLLPSVNISCQTDCIVKHASIQTSDEFSSIEKSCQTEKQSPENVKELSLNVVDTSCQTDTYTSFTNASSQTLDEVSLGTDKSTSNGSSLSEFLTTSEASSASADFSKAFIQSTKTSNDLISDIDELQKINRKEIQRLKDLFPSLHEERYECKEKPKSQLTYNDSGIVDQVLTKTSTKPAEISTSEIIIKEGTPPAEDFPNKIVRNGVKTSMSLESCEKPIKKVSYFSAGLRKLDTDRSKVEKTTDDLQDYLQEMFANELKKLENKRLREQNAEKTENEDGTYIEQFESLANQTQRIFMDELSDLGAENIIEPSFEQSEETFHKAASKDTASIFFMV